MKSSLSFEKAGITLNLVSLFCWILLFLAATDVWHDTGSPDFWRLQGAPYHDLRIFAYIFYALFFVLLGSLIIQIVGYISHPRTQTP